MASDGSPGPYGTESFGDRLPGAALCAAIGVALIVLAHVGVAAAKWLLVRSTTGLTGPLTSLVGGRVEPIAIWLLCLAAFWFAAALTFAAFGHRTVTAAVVSALVPAAVYQVAITLAAGLGVMRGVQTIIEWAWTAGLAGIHDLAGPIALVAAILATAIAWRRLWRPLP